MKPAKPSSWPELKRQALARWQMLGNRERAALKLAGWALALLLCWLIAVAPSLRVLQQTPAQLEAVELQLQDMQALALEARELRSTPTVSAAQASQALQAASEHLGSAARLTLSGDRAVLTVTGVAAEALQAWLGEVRSAARTRPLEASLQRGPKGYSGTVVLGLSGAAP